MLQLHFLSLIQVSSQASECSLGGVYGGRRPWAELVPRDLWDAPGLRLGYLVRIEAVATKPDVWDFLWQKLRRSTVKMIT